MRILVTGSKGQLGSEIKKQHADLQDHEFTFVDIEEMDLGSANAIRSYFNENDFDLVIHCAAYTNVDGAEDNKTLAEQINAQAPLEIAKICANKNMRMIHISTDYVFDGNGNLAITEKDTPNPNSVYGETKLKGEKNVQAVLSSAYIIRTSWVYSTYGNNFVKTMLRLGAEKNTLNVVADQVGTPTYAKDLASAILIIVEAINNGNDQPGIYHYSNEGVCSWYDFAREIMDLNDLDCVVKPIPSSAFPTKAKRPNFSVLNKEKIKATFEIEIPHWKESLKKCCTYE